MRNHGRVRLRAAGISLVLVLTTGAVTIGAATGHAQAEAAPTVTLNDPGTTLHGTVQLTATASADAGRTIASVRFETAPAGTGQWTEVAVASTEPFAVQFNTTALTDGNYDLRAIATDSTGESGTSPVLTRAVANSTAPPTVLLDDPGGILKGTVALSASASASAPRTIASVRFEYAVAGSDDWQLIGTATDAPYQRAFNTTNVVDGAYDLRAVATDDSGATAQSVLTDRVVGNTAESVALTDPGPVLHGGATLRAVIRLQLLPSTTTAVVVTFQRSTVGHRDWTSVATADLTLPTGTGVSATPAAATWDTTGAPDGVYDLRVVADVRGRTLFSAVVPARRVDNTPPSVSMTGVAALVTGRVTLSATADDGTGSGIADVRFEWSPAGGDTWAPIGTDGAAPYALAWDTRSRPNGVYDLRARTTDAAGNEAVSAVVHSIEVSNAERPSAEAVTIRDLAAPAHDLTLLGAPAASPDHETWAYGFTSAAPAEVDGTRLPYTATGNQLVLLRYTDETGWRIDDVLRDADGQSPFTLLAPDQVATNGLLVRGAMASSGDGWLWLRESPADPGAPDVFGLFHRPSGARHFVLDTAATTAVGETLLDPQISSGTVKSDLRIGLDGSGQVYGVLVSPGQQSTPIDVDDSSGAAVSIDARLELALLAGGTWTTETTTVPETYVPHAGDLLALDEADLDGVASGWAAFSASNSATSAEPLLLSRLAGDRWTTVRTGLDVFELTGAFSTPGAFVLTRQLRASGNELWIGATVHLPSGDSQVVARYDASRDEVTEAWCTLASLSSGCTDSLDAFHPAAVPNAIFTTASGERAVAIDANFVDVFADDAWTRTPAPGFSAAGSALFTSPDDGWLAGPTAFGRWLAHPPPSPLVSWPQANRSPVMGIAVPQGREALTADGAVAVGLDGTALRYDPSSGWLVTPVPSRESHVNLLGVACSGNGDAFAVGQFGAILRWDGTAWTEDPQSVSLTQNQLNAVAVADDGEAWAVGTFGTIIHFDGTQWSTESPPAEDEGVNLTSVAVAGGDVFAVAGGNLIERASDGSWQRVDASLLPREPSVPNGSLRLVSAVADGGVIAAGRAVVLERDSPGAPFTYAAQPIEGIAVALAATRDANGNLRALVSVASPAAADPSGQTQPRDVGFPAGDGELLRQTADGGWLDLSEAQYPGGNALPGDGTLKFDPVLAVAASADGLHAWAGGGYAGTIDSAGRGTPTILPARATGWRTSSLWRFDEGTRADPPSLAPVAVDAPAVNGTVSFAYFSGATCRFECAATDGAQPDVNLTGAAGEISRLAEQPGGPSFALLGGNARGPTDLSAYQAGNGAVDLARMPDLLSPLGNLPVFAALGPLDLVPGRRDQTEPWADAFGGAPRPFGSRRIAPGVLPVSSGGPTGNVHRFYDFDVTQNGGTLRVIVLDNSAGSLEQTVAGQTEWLEAQLTDAQAKGLPVVVAAALPLRGTGAQPGLAADGPGVAALLSTHGVLAVFTTSPSQLNERYLVPESPDPGTPQIPEFEGATLGYQQPLNNGVVWYDVAVDTVARQVRVDAIPVIDLLAIKPLEGLNVPRSFTLEFQAIARRPVGSLATTAVDDSFPGFDNYLSIPAPGCGARPCIQPTYRFASSDPTIGDFVAPSGPGSRFPLLDGAGRPVPSSTSGLFCAYNAGTTTISVTTGFLSYSLPVTVANGGFGPPCGTVFRAGVNPIIHVQQEQQQLSRGASGAPPPPPAAPPPVATELPLPAVVPPPVPPPAPVAQPVPQPAPPPATPAPPRPAVAPAAPAVVPAAPAPVVPTPVVVPVPPPPPQPIPPGGAAVPSSSAASAPRREKAKKHASQSAFAIRPAGAGFDAWFFGATGCLALVAVAAVGLAFRGNRRDVAAVAHGRAWVDARNARL